MFQAFTLQLYFHAWFKCISILCNTGIHALITPDFEMTEKCIASQTK